MVAFSRTTGNSPAKSSSIVTPHDLPTWQRIKLAEQRYRTAHREFAGAVHDLLLEANIPVATYRQGTRIIWQDPAGLCGELHLTRYDGPSSSRPDAPLILRVCINTDYWRIPGTTLRSVGLQPASPFHVLPHIDEKLELSVLPREIADFSEWVADWIVARHGKHNGDLLAPAEYQAAWYRLANAPHPLEVPEDQDPRERDYLWSCAAAKEHDVHEQKERAMLALRRQRRAERERERERQRQPA